MCFDLHFDPPRDQLQLFSTLALTPFPTNSRYMLDLQVDHILADQGYGKINLLEHLKSLSSPLLRSV
jgi:hypothetical protein